MSQETVLIVDDSRVNQRLAEILLKKAGYQVRTASDATQAEQAVKEFHPRLILMDVQLPGIDGFELTRRLREDPEAREMLIVACTAIDDESGAETAKSAGCDGFIAKPIDAQTFADQIRRYLEPDAQPTSTDPAEVPAELRKEFIAEGLKSSEAWTGADIAGLDLETVRREVHHWVGIGGTLGYPEITTCARELESMLEATPEQATFDMMRDLFTAAMAAGFEPAATEPSLKAGIFGFDEPEFSSIRGALQTQEIDATDLGTMTEGLSAEFFAAHHLIVLNARVDPGIRAWNNVFSHAGFAPPVIVISSLPEANQLESITAIRPADFIFAPWEPAEVCFRAARILKRRRTEKRRTVVLADDDPMVHSLLKAAFEKVNVDCRSAHDGREALDAIRNSSPDAAILDIGMPRISGLTVLTEIRKSAQTRTIPVLMLTARQQKSEVSMALGFGANDYVVKPFDATDVVTRLLRLMP